MPQLPRPAWLDAHVIPYPRTLAAHLAAVGACPPRMWVWADLSCTLPYYTQAIAGGCLWKRLCPVQSIPCAAGANMLLSAFRPLHPTPSSQRPCSRRFPPGLGAGRLQRGALCAPAAAPAPQCLFKHRTHAEWGRFVLFFLSRMVGYCTNSFAVDAYLAAPTAWCARAVTGWAGALHTVKFWATAPFCIWRVARVPQPLPSASCPCCGVSDALRVL